MISTMESDKTVLANHMGQQFLRLAPLLQNVHTGNKRLAGVVNVRQGNFLARLICNVFRFPRANPKTELIVICQHTHNAMLWQRYFDGHEMQSHFSIDGEFLVEHLGPLAMSFKAVEKDGALHYQFTRTRFLGIPVPAFLSPEIIAFEKEHQGKYVFSVSVNMFPAGIIISYGGELNMVDAG